MTNTLLYTDFEDLKLFRRGKVRDLYDVGEYFLIVSTDRISAFDVVLPTAIPHKGEILNKLSIFWFDFAKELIPNHIVSTNVDEYPALLQKYKTTLQNRSMLVRKATVIPFECVVRGYLAGSGYKEYKEKSSICGVQLPKGLRESDKLPFTVFTPATKEEHGHDVNVNEEYMKKKIGLKMTALIRTISLALYEKAARYAEERGIIIADTKFEFGLDNSRIILIDELLTPDSSRFWPKASYKPGGPQLSYDKQFVRDYLESLDWNKTPPAPLLPDEIVAKTEAKYREALRALTVSNI